MSENKALIGGGCFWGVDSIFKSLIGVSSTLSGYAGGDEKRITYRDICSGTTGHAEVVQVVFNENIISYKDLLNVFWRMHDPTTLNQQGPDKGTQYRSIIYFYDKEQEKMARESRDAYQEILGSKKIVTHIEKYINFFNAEEYHQDYIEKNNGTYSCHIFPKDYQHLLKV